MITLKTIGKCIFSILKIIVLSVFAIGGSVLLIYIFMKYHGETFPKETVAPVIVALRVLILLLVLIVTLYFIRSLWKQRHMFGDTPSARLVGFGVMAIFFPSAVYGLIRLPLYLTTFLVKSLPRLLLEYWPLEQRKDGNYHLGELFQWLAVTVQQALVEIAQALERFIRDLPLTDVVLGLALWIIIGQWLSSSHAEAQEPSGEKTLGNRIVRYYHSLSDTKRHNILLSIIFIVSAYLSMAAIIAIPSLKQGAIPQELQTKNLETRLKEYIMTREDFDKQFQENYRESENPLLKLDKINEYVMALENKSTSVTIPERDRYTWERLKRNWVTWVNLSIEQRNKAEMNRKQMINDWKSYRSDMFDQQKKLLIEATDAYEKQMMVPLSQQQRIFFFQEVVRAFSREMDRLRTSLSEAKLSIDNFYQTLGGWATNVNQAITMRISNVNDYFKEPATHTLPEVSEWEYSTFANLSSYIQFEKPIDFGLRLDIGEPGYGAPFGWVSNWLIRMQSSELTLIIGMLGFGLFGAAISSYVREQSKRAPGEPIVINISNVVVRGLSAAVVVFLAVKGSIAIFTVGNEEPNAYVLFFTCLVGAVFSESVWSWARKRFEQNLSLEQSAAPETTSEKTESEKEKAKE